MFFSYMRVETEGKCHRNFQVTMTFVLLKLTKNSDFFPNFVLTFFL